MSDETGITKHQEQIMQEIVAAVGDPAATMASIGQRFEQMWQRAKASGDGDAMALLQTSWGHIEALSMQQGAAINLAAAARELLESTMEERDAAQDTLADLNTALSEKSESHEKLKEYAAAIRAQENEDVREYAFDAQHESWREGVEIFCEERGIETPSHDALTHLSEKMEGQLDWHPEQESLWLQIIQIEIRLQLERDAAWKRYREEMNKKWEEVKARKEAS